MSSKNTVDIKKLKLTLLMSGITIIIGCLLYFWSFIIFFVVLCFKFTIFILACLYLYEHRLDIIKKIKAFFNYCSNTYNKHIRN